MRVVHVATAFPRDRDDLITPWLVRLLVGLRERGVEAEVLAPAYRGLGSGRVHGIPVRRFRYAPAALETLTHDQTAPDRLRDRPAYAALLPGYVAGGIVAAARIGRERPAVVHAHWPVPHALFGAAMRAAAGGRTALVCSYYSVELNWVDRRLPWLRPFLRWTARTADAVTAISTPTAERLRGLVGGDLEVRRIPFAAAVEEREGGEGAQPGEGEVPPEAHREGRLPLAGDELRLLFVGRLVERKGVEVAVRALPRVLRERPARLTVVGEGAREAQIRDAARAAGVEDRVRFAGRVSDEELRRLYAACDVFLLPAVVDRKGDTEGLGVVLLEALRFGRPVVASDVGGIPDIVEHGRTGWLVPAGDPAALAATLLRLAADPEEARRVARRGREVAGRRFSWDRILDDLLDTYADAVRRRTARRDG